MLCFCLFFFPDWVSLFGIACPETYSTPDWPWTLTSACLCLQRAGTKGLYHHCQAITVFWWAISQYFQSGLSNLNSSSFVHYTFTRKRNARVCLCLLNSNHEHSSSLLDFWLFMCMAMPVQYLLFFSFFSSFFFFVCLFIYPKYPHFFTSWPQFPLPPLLSVSPPLLPFSIYVQKKAGHSWISSKHGISCYIKTKNSPL